MTMLLSFVLPLVGLFITSVTCELLKNPDFEDPTLGSWYPIGQIAFTTVPDARSGLKAARISGRTDYWNGPGQEVGLKPDTGYRISGYVKIMNDLPGKLFQRVDISAALKFASEPTIYPNYASRGFLNAAAGWVHLQGTFQTPSSPITSATLYLQGPDPGVDFQVDAMSLRELGPLWREEADARIEKYRKSDVTLNIQLGSGFLAKDVELEIKHVKHSFAFGTEVSDRHVLDPTYKPYQDLLYGMFNWFTVGTYKWGYSQGTPNKPDYTRTTQVTDLLRQKGFPVRAHAMFWGVEGNDPGWLGNLTPSELNTTLANRVQYMSGITDGRVAHWDVNNELLHGQYYEEKTQDPDLTKKLFSWLHQDNPAFKLFLNDYNVIAGGGATQAFLDMALDFKEADVGLYGLGLQGHFDDGVTPDPALLKLRLDLLSTAGLPLWITEMDLTEKNETRRAEMYETAWRVFFSHPSVEGIILWGFWDRVQYRGPLASLVSGNGYYINEAGKRWLKLTQDEWTTRVRYQVSKGTTTTFRGFHGDYDIIVKNLGQPIKIQKFTLGKGATTVNVLVEGDEPIAVPAAPSLPPYVTNQYTYRVFILNPQTVGVMNSGTSPSLQCVNRLSQPSAIGDDQMAMVRCEAGEVMTSCSSFTEDNSSTRDGEKFELSSGQIACVGVNGFQSVAAVLAQARCCKLTGLSCEARISGRTPAPHQDGDQTETTCPMGTIATGCLAFSYWTGVSDGAFHKPSSCVAQVDGNGAELRGCPFCKETNGTMVNTYHGDCSIHGPWLFLVENCCPFLLSSGVYSSASCCSAPRLQCRIVQSAEGAMSRGSNVTSACNGNEVMVGCSVFSNDGRTAGSRISDGPSPLCEAVSGTDRFPGERGVHASAVCCTGG